MNRGSGEWMARDARRVFLVALLVFQQPVSTAVIVVGGGCTLADAITAANSDSAVGGCSAGAGADELQLTADVTLTAALPAIVTDITLEGGDFTVARDAGAPEFGIFSVLDSPFALRNTTVANGLAMKGGAVYASDSMVTITNSTLTGNHANASGGAIYGYGDFFSSDSLIRVIDSRLLDNSATDGGAIYATNDADTVVLNSTLSGNSASSRGGGIYNNFYSLASITNSTLSGNTAVKGGGIYNALYGDISLSNSTITRNSGSNIYAGWKTGPLSVTVDRNIVAYPVSGSNCGGYTYPFVVGIGNFGDDSSCPSFSPISPGVDFDVNLADNGGPTQTHALLPGSVAVDAAGDCGLAADQRGVLRDDGACDSGSFELAAGMAVGGSVGGMQPREVHCRNETTSQTVSFSLSGENGWDCVAQGLSVGPGDQVRQAVLGRAMGGASGAALGLTDVRARCRNRTTGQTVPIPMSTTSWDCVAEGLQVSPGDRVEQAFSGAVP